MRNGNGMYRGEVFLGGSDNWLEVAQLRAFQAEGVAWAEALRWEVKKHGEGRP